MLADGTEEGMILPERGRFRFITLSVKNDLLYTSTKQDPEVVRVPSSKQIGGGVPETSPVEDGATNLGSVDMVKSVPVKRRDAGFQQPVPERSLPRCNVGPVDYPLLHPWIRLVHQLAIPTCCIHIAAQPYEQPNQSLAPSFPIEHIDDSSASRGMNDGAENLKT